MTPEIEDRLRQVCYELASSIQWEHQDAQSTSLDNVTPAARRYFDIAMMHTKSHDPVLVLRAVKFLGQAFACPPWRHSDAWLDGGLNVLLYLFHPWDEAVGETGEFMADLRNSIQRALDGESSEQPE